MPQKNGSTKSLLFRFIVFRFKQLSRALGGVGAFRVILIIPFLLFFAFLMLKRVAAADSSYLLIFYFGLTFFSHFIRKDLFFLKKLNIDEKKVYLLEYNLLILPLTILVSFIDIVIAGIGHLTVSIVAFIPLYRPFEQSLSNTIYLNWIPITLFEWRSILRKYFWVALLSYLAGIVLSFRPFIFPIFIFYWTSLIASVFSYNEPKEVVEEFFLQNNFLKYKIKKNSIFLHLLLIPHYLLFLFFHHKYWYLLIALIVFTQATLVFCILFKYSQYNHFARSIHNQLPFAVFFIVTLLFFPVGILLIYKYWKQAKHNVQDASNK